MAREAGSTQASFQRDSKGVLSKPRSPRPGNGRTKQTCRVRGQGLRSSSRIPSTSPRKTVLCHDSRSPVPVSLHAVRPAELPRGPSAERRGLERGPRALLISQTGIPGPGAAGGGKGVLLSPCVTSVF